MPNAFWSPYTYLLNITAGVRAGRLWHHRLDRRQAGGTLDVVGDRWRRAATSRHANACALQLLGVILYAVAARHCRRRYSNACITMDVLGHSSAARRDVGFFLIHWTKHRAGFLPADAIYLRACATP